MKGSNDELQGEVRLVALKVIFLARRPPGFRSSVSRDVTENPELEQRLAELEDLARRQQGELDALEARPERLEAVTQQLTQELRRKVLYEAR